MPYEYYIWCYRNILEKKTNRILDTPSFLFMLPVRYCGRFPLRFPIIARVIYSGKEQDIFVERCFRTQSPRGAVGLCIYCVCRHLVFCVFISQESWLSWWWPSCYKLFQILEVEWLARTWDRVCSTILHLPGSSWWSTCRSSTWSSLQIRRHQRLYRIWSERSAECYLYGKPVIGHARYTVPTRQQHELDHTDRGYNICLVPGKSRSRSGIRWPGLVWSVRYICRSDLSDVRRSDLSDVCMKIWCVRCYVGI